MDRKAREEEPVWLHSTKEAVRSFPAEVRCDIGFAISQAELGGKAPNAKPLKGFSGAGVLEIVSDFQTDTYRAVYTVRLAERIYVLHAFQKKSKTGIATPKQEIELIKRRLREAEDIHREWLAQQKEKTS